MIPDLPKKVNRIVNQALAKEPARRYHSCDEMREEIEECMDSLSLRYNASDMAEYMTTLFEKEYVAEKKEASEAMKYSAPSKSSYVKTEIVNRNYEKTNERRKSNAANRF